MADAVLLFTLESLLFPAALGGGIGLNGEDGRDGPGLRLPDLAVLVEGVVDGGARDGGDHVGAQRRAVPDIVVDRGRNAPRDVSGRSLGRAALLAASEDLGEERHAQMLTESGLR